MTKTIKILITFVMCILMLSALSVNMFADEFISGETNIGDTSVMPLWDNINTYLLHLDFYNGMGNATGSATKKDGVTSMDGVVEVYIKENGSWVLIGTWTNTTKRNTLAVSADFEAVEGEEYKAVFTVNAYRGTVVESHTDETTAIY